MLIKVCGMREADNIRAIEHEVQPDWMGFIFCPRSSRYVADVPAYLPTTCTRVGVFVDEDINGILRRVCDFDLMAVQLHGHETPDFLRDLRRRLPDEVIIIKALPVASASDLEAAARYVGCAAPDVFLFDTKLPPNYVPAAGKKPKQAASPDGSEAEDYNGILTSPISIQMPPLPGGNGLKFDWRVLEAYEGTVPFLLSGGIGPEDVEAVRGFRHPRFVGIDLNSRFETAPGVKDVAALRNFISQCISPL